MLVRRRELCQDAPGAPSGGLPRAGEGRGSPLAWGGGASGGDRCVSQALRGADERVAVLGRHVWVRLRAVVDEFIVAG